MKSQGNNYGYCCQALSLGFGKALLEIFNRTTALKRAYEFLPTRKQNLPN
ncbi:MAG: IS4/Tn5 family transposase DNA-binding protein [Brasilonema sp.]